ncbi:MAG TPA: hypothetical protein VF809_01590 [Candidatus Saccharimonadales bacterium]
MYPDDQQPPTNRNTIGEAPRPFVTGQMPSPEEPSYPQQQMHQPQPQAKRPKEKHSNPKIKWVLIGLGALLVIVLLVVGIILAAKDNKNDGKGTTTDTSSSDSSSSSTSTDDECTAQQRRYQNEDLDIKFCYPKSWGDVKLADSKFDPSDDGTRQRISFADKDEVHLGLVSDDWSTDVARDGTCVDMAVQAFPDTGTFSARWVAEPATGSPVSAVRGLEVTPDVLLIQEQVDELLNNGVCLEGYNAFGGVVYRNATATYYNAFGGAITTPQAHIDDPTVLIPATDRAEFAKFVKSISKF